MDPAADAGCSMGNNRPISAALHSHRHACKATYSLLPPSILLCQPATCLLHTKLQPSAAVNYFHNLQEVARSLYSFTVLTGVFAADRELEGTALYMGGAICHWLPVPHVSQGATPFV